MGFLDSQKLNWFLGQAKKKMEAGDHRGALPNYLNALKVKLSAKDTSGLGGLYRDIGICYLKMDDKMDAERSKHIGKAAEYFKKSAESYRDGGNPLDAGISYEFAANSHDLLKEYSLAAEFGKLSAEMYSEANQLFQSSHAYYNSAQYYQSMGDCEKAAEAYVKAAELDIELKDHAKASKNYQSAGACYWKLEEYPKALDVYYLSAGLDDKIGDYVSASKAHEMIARCEEKLGKTEEAIKEHEKSYQIDVKEGLDDNAIDSLLNEGVDYQKVGEHEKAINVFMKAAKISAGEKNNMLEGRSLFLAAVSYEFKGDHESAIDTYMRSAEASMLAKKREDAHEAYKRAVALNTKKVEAAEKAGDYLSAATGWGKIAESYHNLRDEERAADAGHRRGLMLLRAGKIDESRDSFKMAAEAYVAANIPGKAAESYITAEQYQKAADFYTKNAVDLIRQKKYFEAAESYKTASWCYERLRMSNQVKDYCNKYAWQYHTFIDEGAKSGGVEPAKKAVALKNMGEANYRMDLPKKALPHLEKAKALFDQLDNSNESALVDGEITLISGLIDAAEARWSDSVGKYSQAREKLSRIDRSGFDEFYSAFVGGLVEKTQVAMKEIESKPDVLLTVDQPESLMVSQEAVLNGVISNNGVLPVCNINFLPYCPEGIKVIEAPKKISEVKPKENARIEIKVEPSELGEYHFKPLEILYQDNEGKKYMKASNEIKVRVVVSPEEKRKAALGVLAELIKRVESQIEENFAGLPKGSAVLVLYDPQAYTQVYLSIIHYLLSARGQRGVYVAAGNPSKSIMSSMAEMGVDANKVMFVDCISYLSGGTPEVQDNVVYVENPELLEQIELSIDNALKKISGEKFVIFDSVSSMLVYNDSKSLEEFIHSLANKLRLQETLGVVLLARGELTQKIERTLTQFVDKELIL